MLDVSTCSFRRQICVGTVLEASKVKKPDTEHTEGRFLRGVKFFPKTFLIEAYDMKEIKHTSLSFSHGQDDFKKNTNTCRYTLLSLHFRHIEHQ